MKKILKKSFAFLLCVVMLATCAPLDGFVFEAEAEGYSVGDIILFGEYPQNAVIEEYMIKQIQESPMTSDGYYYYNGKKYISYNSVFYSFDPIEWRVLSVESDCIYIMSEKILDYQRYHWEDVSITWAFSSLRTWLNNDFYNQAFHDNEKLKILTTLLENEDFPANATSGGIDTYDKIWVPSYSDITNIDYGFSSSRSAHNEARKAKLTGYSSALANMVSSKTSDWWLRTPGASAYCALYIDYNGTCYVNGYYSYAYNQVICNSGIRPALRLNTDSLNCKIKKNSSYSIKLVDSITQKPVSGATVTFNEKSVGVTDVNGVYTIKVGNNTDFNQTISFNHENYKIESRRLYDLNPYSTNEIAMVDKFDISESLSSFYLGSEKISGPSISIAGDTFPLFSLDVGLEFGDISFKHQQDTKEKKIKYILGISDGFKIESEGDFYKNYNDFKEFYSSYSNAEKWDRYKELQGKLKKTNKKLGVSCEIEVAGYLEYDYSSGNMVFKEGGMVVLSKNSISQDVPWGSVCYATFGVAVDIGGNLRLERLDSGYIVPASSISLSLKPSFGAGFKIIHKRIFKVEAGVEGEIKGTLEMGRTSLSDSLKIEMSLNGYVEVKGWFVKDARAETNFPNMELYPNFGSIQTNSVIGDISVNCDDLNVIARDYLNAVQIETQSIEDIINQYSVYPYPEPRLAKLNDGRIVAVWVYDNGTKSSMNRTTLYYSVYDNGTWSTPSAIFESGFAEEDVKLVTDGVKVYALWKRAAKQFADEITDAEMLSNTDLVYSEFDGTWTEPVVVGNVASGMYPSSHSIAIQNGTVAITWAEDSENFAEDTDGTTTIYTQQNIGGEWGTVNTAATLNNMSSLAVGFVDGNATIAYTTDLDGDTSTTGDSEVYIGSTQLTNDTTDDYDVTYQNGEFWYLANGYLANNNIVTNLYVGGNYSVLNNGTTTAVVYPVADGFKSELYVAYKETDGYSTPVALTSIGKHVADYFAIIDSENTIVAAMAVRNIDESATGYPYTSTDFIIDNIGQLADLEMSENIYYDTDRVVAGNEIAFTTTIKNIGTAAINRYTINLKDASGKTVAAREFEGSIASGETIEADVIYTLPDDFRKQTYTIEVVSNDDGKEENNTATVEIGYADIEVVSCEITDVKIVATVTNNGYETVTNAKADFSRFTTESALLGTIAIGELEPGEVETVEYILPVSQLLFDTPYSSNRFIVEVTSDTEEISSVNNTAEVLHSPKAVEGISLNTSEVTIDIGTTHQLLATIVPSDAYNKVVHWVSDSTNIVEVDEYTGELTAVSGGTAIITAITDDGGYVAQCVVTVNVGVKSVDMSQGEADMTVGQSLTLTANINPTGASNKNISWTSSNEKVATVDNGVVSALKTGTTTVTVTTEDGGYTAECIINVTNPVTGIAISDTTAMMYLDGTKQLTATVAPLDADDATVIWSSSDDYTVSVDQNGLLTAVGTGTAVITARTQDGGYTATCMVTVGKHVSNVILSESSLILNVGYTEQLKATILPLNATDKSVEWLSTNENVATVDADGNVTAHKAGTATIIVSTNDGGYYATCEVFVCSTVVGFEITNKSELLTPTETVQMKPVFEPADAENQNITWTSSDATIASVDEYGLVTANKTGSAVIIATTEDGGYRDYCMVRVVSINAKSETNTVIDLQSSSIYGLDAGIDSLDDYVTVSDEDCVLEYESTQNGFGTGTLVMLTVNGEIVDSYTVVIFGDVNGDGWYDGEDAFLVNLIAKGMLDKDDVGEAIWMAADCNHDGEINEADVDLLSGAGLKLNDVDQSKTTAELATNAEYIEYVMLIDQSAGMHTGIIPEPDTDDTEQETSTPDTNGTVDSNEPATETDIDIEVIFANIIDFIKKLFALVLSFVIK